MRNKCPQPVPMMLIAQKEVEVEGEIRGVIRYMGGYTVGCNEGI